MKSNDSIKIDSSSFSYVPYLHDKGLLSVGGRLEFCDFLINKKHSIILPKSSWLSTLIVHKEQGKMMHGGTGSALAKVRSDCWILKGLQFIKRAIKSCIICKRYLARPADQLTALCLVIGHIKHLYSSSAV